MGSKFFGNKHNDKALQQKGGKKKFNSNNSVKSTVVRKTGRGK